MKLIALFSGGKDSTYAVHWAVLQGFRICKLVTFVPRREDSWMLHRPFAEYTRIQAEAMGLDHELHYVSGTKELEAEEMKNILKRIADECNAYGIVAGALLSDYQRMRFAFIAKELGLKIYSPLWRIDQSKHLLNLVKQGFEILIVSITAFGLPLSFLGKVLTEDDVKTLIKLAKKYGFNPAFEGGEAETFVIKAPLFRKRICVDYEKVIVSEYEGFLRPREVYLC